MPVTRPLFPRLPNEVTSLGSFILQVLVVCACALYLSPRLVGRWFACINPMLGVHTTISPADWYLQHLELVTLITAFVTGYLGTCVFYSFSRWIWIAPALVLTLRMILHKSPSASVLGGGLSAFEYCFAYNTGCRHLLSRS